MPIHPPLGNFQSGSADYVGTKSIRLLYAKGHQLGAPCFLYAVLRM
jgi:hypothetical protein